MAQPEEAMTRDRKINPDDYIVGPDTKVSDIDLDREEFHYRGKRLTEAEAERLAEKALDNIRHGQPSLERVRAGRGRPSLSGKPQRSPQVAFRLPPELRAEAEAQAAREGKRVSELARRALEEYLARHREAS
jgi:predicted DNA-binding protein